MNVTAAYRFIVKPLTFAACAIPAVLMTLGILAATGKISSSPMDLGADPVNRLIHACGITALILLLIPLAVTSTNAMIRRLGKRWQKLHRLIYVIALLGLWHFWWQVKKDIREPLLYAGIFAVLMGWRLWHRQRVKARSAPATAPGRT